MRRLLSVLSAVAICAWLAQSASAQILWDNGPLVTHPGAGPGGVDVSMASSVPNAAGSNVNANVWRADDFMVGAPGWIVNNIHMFAYDTGNQPPRWTDGTMQIRQNDAGMPGAVVGTAMATWQLAGINRTFNGVTTNTDRQVNRLTADFGGLSLAPGEYWVSLTVTMPAGVNAWMPYVMDPNPNDPNDPITRVGNSMVSTDAGTTWSPGVVTTNMWNQQPEFPFVIEGQVIPEPGTAGLLLVLGSLALAGARRRR